MVLADVHGRRLRNLRLSVTDKCNLRCAYCMPEENYVWLPRDDILTFDEIARRWGIPASTLKTRHRVAMDRLRRRLGPKFGHVQDDGPAPLHEHGEDSA